MISPSIQKLEIIEAEDSNKKQRLKKIKGKMNENKIKDEHKKEEGLLLEYGEPFDIFERVEHIEDEPRGPSGKAAASKNKIPEKTDISEGSQPHPVDTSEVVKIPKLFDRARLRSVTGSFFERAGRKPRQMSSAEGGSQERTTSSEETVDRKEIVGSSVHQIDTQVDSIESTIYKPDKAKTEEDYQDIQFKDENRKEDNTYKEESLTTNTTGFTAKLDVEKNDVNSSMKKQSLRKGSRMEMNKDGTFTVQLKKSSIVKRQLPEYNLEEVLLKHHEFENIAQTPSEEGVSNIRPTPIKMDRKSIDDANDDKIKKSVDLAKTNSAPETMASKEVVFVPEEQEPQQLYDKLNEKTEKAGEIEVDSKHIQRAINVPKEQGFQHEYDQTSDVKDLESKVANAQMTGVSDIWKEKAMRNVRSLASGNYKEEKTLPIVQKLEMEDKHSESIAESNSAERASLLGNIVGFVAKEEASEKFNDEIEMKADKAEKRKVEPKVLHKAKNI